MAPLVFDIETKNGIIYANEDSKELDISVVGIYDFATNTLKAFQEHEFKDMWPYFEKATEIIGYNSDYFDIPMLNRYYNGDLNKIKSIDLLKTIKQSLGRRVKLQDVASATLGVSKSGQGIDAVIWWREGKIDKIIEYCLKDVEITRDLYNHMKTHKKVVVPEGKGTYQVDLDISEWEKDTGNKITHAMPW
jgi:DEAD/DEAH box helicase domain-containing protein